MSHWSFREWNSLRLEKGFSKSVFSLIFGIFSVFVVGSLKFFGAGTFRIGLRISTECLPASLIRFSMVLELFSSDDFWRF